MDDGNLISQSRETLQVALSNVSAICKINDVTLNKKKTQIINLRKGIPFLKRRFKLCNNGRVVVIPTKAGQRRMYKKVRKFAKMIAEGKLTTEQADASFQSFRSTLKKSNAYFRLKRLDAYYNKKIHQGEHYGNH